MKLMQSMQKVPAGMLNVPMAITALIHTFFPSALTIGGATTALFNTGTTTLIGLMLFVTGSQFKTRMVKNTLERGAVLIVVKLLIGVGGSWLLLQWLPAEGIWGIPLIALVAILTATNPGIYLAICNRHGDEIDKANFGLLNLISVPTLAIFCMALDAQGGFQWMILIQVLIPFLAGMLVGNLDDQLSDFLKPGSGLILPFLGFCFGSVIDLKLVVASGWGGLLLTLIYIIANVPLLFIVDRFILGRPGYAALGVASAAGISVTVPILYAQSHPDYAQYASQAAAQIATVVVITSFLMPYLANQLGKAPLLQKGLSNH